MLSDDPPEFKVSLEGWKSNIHGYIHGKRLNMFVNTGSVEEMTSTHSRG
jgi:hypothetical protein